MRPASAQKASPAAVKYASSAAARTRSTARVEAEVVGQIQGLVADAVLAAQGRRPEQVVDHRVAGLQPGGDVAAGGRRGAGEGAPGGVPAVDGSDGRRAAEGGLAAAEFGAAGELAGQGQRLGEQGGAGGGLEGACLPGDLRRQLRLAAEGGPDGDADAVARGRSR